MKDAPLDVPDREEATVIGPNTNVKLALTIALGSVIAWGGWVTSELNTACACAPKGWAGARSVRLDRDGESDFKLSMSYYA